jgi:hypothetical protein
VRSPVSGVPQVQAIRETPNSQVSTAIQPLAALPIPRAPSNNQPVPRPNSQVSRDIPPQDRPVVRRRAGRVAQ